MLKKISSPRKRFSASTRNNAAAAKEIPALRTDAVDHGGERKNQEMMPDEEAGAMHQSRKLSRSPRGQSMLLSTDADPKGRASAVSDAKTSPPRLRGVGDEKDTISNSIVPELKLPTRGEVGENDGRPQLIRTPRIRSGMGDDEAKASSAPASTLSPSPISPGKKKRDALSNLNILRKKDKDNSKPGSGDTQNEGKQARTPKSSRLSLRSRPRPQTDEENEQKEKPVDDGKRKGRRSLRKNKLSSKNGALKQDNVNNQQSEDDLVRGTDRLSPIRRKVEQTANRNGSSSRSQLPTYDNSISPAEQPEVHIIGEIVGGNGFGPGSGFCCKWSVEYGSHWTHISGDQIGQTQVDSPSSSSAVWGHPLDLHFVTSSMQGWPKLLIQVWRVDSDTRPNIVGYGVIHVPFASGNHSLSVALWRPLGSTKEMLGALFFGQTPELTTDELLYNKAWAERCRLKTIGAGCVQINLGIIVRNLSLVQSCM